MSPGDDPGAERVGRHPAVTTRRLILQRFKWAAARLGFYSYVAFSLITVVGGYLTAPVMTYYFFGDWRFWKHLSPAWKLFFHGWKMAGLILRGQNDGFLLSVPLTSPPNTSPDSTVVRLSRDWEHGGSCGPCARCCELIGHSRKSNTTAAPSG
jgi:hypothetical protein